MMNSENLVCPVCHGACSLLDVVDLNKACLRVLPLSGIPVYYAWCGGCGFCFAPDMMGWSPDEFAQRIYNDEYAVLDPEYSEIRPRANARVLQGMFRQLPSSVKHLDYGGGHGALAKILGASGWNSLSYDPLVSRDVSPAQLGQFSLVTAFEVFEHMADVRLLMSHLNSLVSPDGIVLFSTLVSDGHIRPGERLGWWYASPRNGHISLFSKKSLAILARDSGFNFGSFSAGFHVFFRTIPSWATMVIRASA